MLLGTPKLLACMQARYLLRLTENPIAHRHQHIEIVLLNLTLNQSVDTASWARIPARCSQIARTHTHRQRLEHTIWPLASEREKIETKQKTILGTSTVSSAGIICQWWIFIKTKRIAWNSRNRFCHFVLFFLFIYFVRSTVVETLCESKKNGKNKYFNTHTVHNLWYLNCFCHRCA